MIRRIENKDIEDIIKLENETLNTTLGEELLKMAVTSSMAYYYVYIENNKIIGYISSSFDDVTIEILNFCVDKEYQHKGIGTKLISHLFTELLKKGANNSILEVRESNIKAISFYERIGYKKISIRKNYYSNGENAHVLQKIFTPFEDISLNYMNDSSIIKNEKDYISYRNDNFKLKYDFNKYEIINEDHLEKLIKKIKKDNDRDFLELETPNRHNDLFPDMVESNCIIMHSNIYAIDINIKHNNICKYEDKYKDDYYDIVFNNNKAYGEEYAKLNALYKIDMLNKKPNNYKSYLIYDNNNAIGVIDAYLFLDNAYLEDFEIKEEYQNQGYGSSLFMYALNDLKMLGIKEIYLEADNYDTPKEMYKIWGFGIIGSYYSYHEDY